MPPHKKATRPNAVLSPCVQGGVRSPPPAHLRAHFQNGCGQRDPESTGAQCADNHLNVSNGVSIGSVRKRCRVDSHPPLMEILPGETQSGRPDNHARPASAASTPFSSGMPILPARGSTRVAASLQVPTVKKHSVVLAEGEVLAARPREFPFVPTSPLPSAEPLMPPSSSRNASGARTAGSTDPAAPNVKSSASTDPAGPRRARKGETASDAIKSSTRGAAVKSEPPPASLGVLSNSEADFSSWVKTESKSDISASVRTKTSVSTQRTRRGLGPITEDCFEPINCWWEKEPSDDGVQWNYLEHHGLIFTPAYKPHNVPVLCNGEFIHLPPEAEEVANFWCQAMDSDYGKKERFVTNFWAAFKQRLPINHSLQKAEFEEVDFSKIKQHLDNVRESIKEQRRNATKEERELEKQRKESEEGAYMYAIFDWLREKVGTFKAEPLTLFRGRGEHPKMGVLKRRLFPEEVTLNCHEDAPVPRLPPDMAGHSWKDVVHDNSVSWLAYYRDTVNGQFKYTFLGAGSAVKGLKDHLKYEKARRLRNYIDMIRKDYTEKMHSTDIVERQLGTATYMLDVLALRVGNEKDSTEEADTVGCCSLRVEHISFNKDASTITLDFLGKDSIRYLNTVKVDALALRNLMAFCRDKAADDDIFDKISTGVLNKYLRDLMPSLSAKVFRTYNASVTLQNELDKLDPSIVNTSNVDALKQFYDSANRAVAILCNHQRSIPKQHESSMDRMKSQLHKVLMDIEELKAYIAWMRSDRNRPFQFVPSTHQVDMPCTGVIVHVSVIKSGFKLEAAKRKLLQLEKKHTTLELRIRIKDENKTVSNNTSKQHYMDPRITVAFCKKWEMPIEKLFNTTLRKKFPWAMYARSDYVF